MTFPQYTNTWFSTFMPIVSSQTFDNTANPYNVSRIINEDLTFNIDEYKAYSPLFISASFALSYGLSFGAISSTLTHIFLYYRKQLMSQARRSLTERPDVHVRLMSVYKEVPIWWYLILFSKSISETRRVHVFTAFVVTMFGFGVAVIEIWHSQFPVWAFILSLIIGAPRIPIWISYLVWRPSSIQPSFIRSLLVSLRLSRTSKSVLTSSRSLSSAICSQVDRSQ